MSAEEVLNLFDSRWFGQEIETQSPQTPQEQNPDLRFHEEPEKPDLSRWSTLHVRSPSDQSLFSSNPDQDSVSPTSVLVPKLQTILSGKVMKEEPRIEAPKVLECGTKGSRRLLRKKKKLSKSLSELEFDELKGFMDLGFVFSEEDKDSSLVSIIPGLQRFGSREEENKVHVVVSRPYLSEAWDVMEQRKKEKKKPLMMISWGIADLRNEMDMKDHLKFWARSVASTVR